MVSCDGIFLRLMRYYTASRFYSWPRILLLQVPPTPTPPTWIAWCANSACLTGDGLPLGGTSQDLLELVNTFDPTSYERNDLKGYRIMVTRFSRGV